MAYEAPTVIRIGSIAGLTSSSLKCSPGLDGINGKLYHKNVGGTLWLTSSLDEVGLGTSDKIVVGQEPAQCTETANFIGTG